MIQPITTEPTTYPPDTSAPTSGPGPTTPEPARRSAGLTGAQRGTTKVEYWYSAEGFDLVRMARDIDLKTNSPVGDITYRENDEWRLASQTPQR